MGFPKLKNPGLCRLMPYVIILGAAILAITGVIMIPGLPDLAKAIICIAIAILLLVYIFKNFATLMSMDLMFATLCCRKTVRTKYPLKRSEKQIRNAIGRFGRKCDPISNTPQPEQLRYRFSHPWTVYNKGIERVVASYSVDLLDQSNFKQIISSAKTNSMKLAGRKKALFLDSEQKKAPLHRVTVIVIFAKSVDIRLTDRLYKMVQKYLCDEEENCYLPCVIDLQNKLCYFDAMRVPYIGFTYAVKNRGIKLIKNKVFGGRLPLTKENALPFPTDVTPDTSLWTFWKEIAYDYKESDKQEQQKLAYMENNQISYDEDMLTIKIDGKAICQLVVINEDTKVASIEKIDYWYYPKVQPISKKTIATLEHMAIDYFTLKGYTVHFD